MYLITGVTGHFGRTAAQTFLKNNNDQSLAILVRDATKVADLEVSGAEVRIGDYGDYNSLLSAFAGVERLLFVSSNDMENRMSHHTNVIQAAKEAGVKHLVFTSFQFVSTANDSPNAPLMKVYVATENLLKSSGMDYTILRDGLYMDMLPNIIGPAIGQQKTLYAPAGTTEVAFTLRAELAEASALVLAGTDYVNQTLDLTANQAITFPEIAQQLSTIFKEEIHYVSPTIPEYQKSLSEAGLPEVVVGLFSGIMASINAGEFRKTTTSLAQILQREPLSVTNYLTEVYSKK
ncbi:SDR family oxidoreductase [Flavobacterium sp. HSC-61S13]|uniref:SDR family oxidoreductase n=1 Tax=Flavobacterium sp. HSC-61S13 TaxID=2910963 RepID=UPI00209D0F84|nr:SDR family oxidoreductase [Flavobacterium sp. HSC-61S13]MCP1995579.1 NAD(P)H dehydrogenase (quinone) [Flavobacterium sp. HSC-61S13]